MTHLARTALFLLLCALLTATGLPAMASTVSPEPVPAETAEEPTPSPTPVEPERTPAPVEDGKHEDGHDEVVKDDPEQPEPEQTEQTEPAAPSPQLTAQQATGTCTPIDVTALGSAPAVSAHRDKAVDAECYSFTTTDPQTYAVRLVPDSTNWNPYVTITDAAGSAIWSSYVYGYTLPIVQLGRASTYQVNVSGDPGTQPDGYRLGLYTITGATNTCDELTDLSWSAPDTTVPLPDGAVGCRQLQADAQGHLRIQAEATDGQGVLRVVNAAGAVICSNQWWSGTASIDCQLQGGGPYRLLSTASDDSPTAALTMSVVDVTSSEGCAVLGAAAWDAALPVSTTRDATGAGEECFRFDSAGAGTYLLRSRFASNQWSPTFEVWDGVSGERVVGTSGSHLLELSLREARSYRIIVTGDPNGFPRGYDLGLFDLAGSAGCAPIGSLDWSSPGSAGAHASGSLDCLTFSATAGSSLRSQLVRTSSEGESHAQFFNAAGRSACGEVSTQHQSATQCLLTGAGPYKVVVRGGQQADWGEYRLHLNDTKSTQGCTSVPLAQWNEELPGGGDREAAGKGAECFTVVTGAAGQHALRPWFASTSWASRGVELWEAGGSQLLHIGGWGAENYLHQVGLRQAFSYRVIVSGNPDGYPPEYRFGLFDLAGSGSTGGATGCAAVPSLAFGAAALEGSTTRGRLDCRQVNAPAGSYVWLRLADVGEVGEPVARLVNKAGEHLCELSSQGTTGCRLTGVAPFRLLVRDSQPREDAHYRMWVANPADEQGCEPAAESMQSGAPPLVGTLDGHGTSACFSLGSEVGNIFGALEGSGTRVTVINKLGATQCEFQANAYSPGTSCSLPTINAPYKALVTNQTADEASYRLLLRRLTDTTTGCTSIPTMAYGFGPLTGRLDAPLSNRCYTVEATNGDHFRLTKSHLDGGQPPALFVFKPNGALLCSAAGPYWWAQTADCTADVTGRHTVLMLADEASVGRYSLSATCQNPACGPDELTVLGAQPHSVGRTSSVTVTLQGKNFDLGHEVALYRNDVEVTGRPIEVSEDRRTMRVLFDLTRAELGLWAVRVRAADGTSANYADAVNVTGPGDPEVTATLTGLGRFVPGRTQTVNVSIANTGNVDGIGVPLIIDGMPAGTTIEPQFELEQLDDGGRAEKATFNPAQDMYTAEDGTMGLPLFINRVPAGGKLDIAFRITVPTQTNFALSADISECWVEATSALLASNGKGLTSQQVGPTGFECANAAFNTMADLAFESVPGAACISGVRDISQTVIGNWADRGAPWKFGGWGKVLSAGVSTAFSALDCATDVFPATKALKVAVDAARIGKEVWTYGSLGTTCFEDGMNLGYEWVSSLDPNEIVGPAGGGSTNAIRGEGVQRYAVYFENSKEATAPAQVVTINSTLDAADFDMSTLTFGGLSFGNTSWTPSEGSRALDNTIDVAGGELQLHIKATKTASGQLSWVLETIDPATGRLPEDPFLGFLPPNHNGTEGQGVLYFDVAYTDAVTSGDEVSAKASIVFDLNEPIETNVWSNRIDRTAPTAKVNALPATSNAAFPVSWTAADAASGIGRVDVLVATDGGDYRVWKAADGGGTATFEGTPGHTYAFSAIAVDDAGNSSAIPSSPHAVTKTLIPITYTGAAPRIAGKPKVGRTVKVAVSLTQVVPTTAKVSYAWLRNGKPISGATKSSYRLTSKDKGRSVSARLVFKAPDHRKLTLKTPAIKVR